MRKDPGDVGKHFHIWEFLCRCGRVDCDAPDEVHPELAAKLNELRELWGKPLVVTSGMRCRFWNEKKKGATSSQHLYGKAADLRVANRNDAKGLAALADRVGFKGVGVGATFVHVDVRAGKRARWEYP